jgi:hypothetical protein
MSEPTGRLSALAWLLLGLLGACRTERRPMAAQVPEAPELVGEWRATLQFTSGAFAAVKDLEFMYAFNQGGTMTESSNYDASPPVPPAYGIWRRVGDREFEAKYEFYVTRAPGSFGEIAKGGGWGPAGRGVFLERITLSEHGDSFSSRIRYEQYDTAGKPAEGGGEATGRGVRLRF